MLQLATSNDYSTKISRRNVSNAISLLLQLLLGSGSHKTNLINSFVQVAHSTRATMNRSSLFYAINSYFNI